MAQLTDKQKHEVVELLACFRQPQEIVDLLREEHGIECDRRRIGSYDPTRPYYDAGEKWRAIFEARRKAYLEQVQQVPIANQGFRLQRLHEAAEAARKAKQWTLMAGLLEQAAKEVGGVLTNQRHTTIDERRQSVLDMTPDERRAQLTEFIRKVQDDMRREEKETVQ